MFDPNQQYQAPQMGGLGASSPILAAMLQKYMANQAMNPQQPQAQPPSTPGQVMGMANGTSQNWNSSMPQQPAFGQMPMNQNSVMGQIVSPQVTNG